MNGAYCPDPGLQTAVSAALEFYGLEADLAAANRRPGPAQTFADQMRRIDLGGKVVALVRRSVPVSGDDRLLIERLVDSASARREDLELPAPPSRSPVADSVVIAYAAAGGGLIGPFEEFRRTFVSSAELLKPAVDRQDVKPAPLTTNPRRTPNPPGTATPVKTNPTRTIRSSRWTAGRKAARS